MRSDYNATVKETPTEKVYTFTPKTPPQEQGPKGLAERMLDVQTQPVLPSIGIGNAQAVFKSPLGSKPAPVRPLAPIAGIVATGESLVYTVPKLLGVKGLPESPPTVTGGLIGKGIAGGAGVFGFNVSNNELEQIVFNERYGAAYGVGTVFGDILTGVAVGKAINYGVKSYRMVAPKVNVLAEGVASKAELRVVNVAYKVKAGREFNFGSNVIEPAYKKIARANALLEGGDRGIASSIASGKYGLKLGLTEPLKQKFVYPITSRAGQAKNLIIQEAKLSKGDIAFAREKFNPVHTKAYEDLVGKIAPNKAAFSGPLPEDYQIASQVLKRLDSGKSLVRKVSVAKKGKQFELIGDNVVERKQVPKISTKLYASPITKRLILSKPLPKDYEIANSVLKRLERAERIGKVKTPLINVSGQMGKASKVVVGKARKVKSPFWVDTSVPPEIKELKALGKVGSGKLRYELKLKTPKDVMLKSERTPLKFEVPKPETAEPHSKGKFDTPKIGVAQSAVQIQRSVVGPAGKTKISNMVGGMSKVAGAYPGVKMRLREEEETVYLSTPKGILKLDTPQSTRVTQLRMPKLMPTSMQGETSFTIPNLTQTTMPRVDIVTGQRLGGGLKETTTTMPKLSFKTAQNSIVKTTFKPFIPNLPRGGGSGFGGSVNPLTGKWKKRNTRIKRYDEMMGTFGFKLSKQTVKSINKIGNSIIRDRGNKRSSRRQRKR
ncbi:MAG: hypothetical protein IMZ53_10810 [Thermoplasmata archaeon]|nr:hypothetical protein [Thermoplasmata archaeon]